MTTQYADLIETVVDGAPATYSGYETLCSLVGLSVTGTPYDVLMWATRERMAELEADVEGNQLELRMVKLALRQTTGSDTPAPACIH